MPLGSLTFTPRHGAATTSLLETGLSLRGEFEWIVTGPSGEVANLWLSERFSG